MTKDFIAFMGYCEAPSIIITLINTVDILSLNLKTFVKSKKVLRDSTLTIRNVIFYFLCNMMIKAAQCLFHSRDEASIIFD